MHRRILTACIWGFLLAAVGCAVFGDGLLFGMLGLIGFAAWVCRQAYDYDNPQPTRDSWLFPNTASPKWDYRYSRSPLQPTIYIRNICTFGNWTLDWHVIVLPDADDAFHSHPGTAWRLIVWGGYVEELPGRFYKWWFPGRIGRVTPDYVHRVHHVNRSYSLWLRGPSVVKTKLIGAGWNKLQ